MGVLDVVPGSSTWSIANWRHIRWLAAVHNAILGVLLSPLLFDILEVPPLVQNLHRLNILDGSKLFPVVLVAAKRVKVDLLSEALVFIFDKLKNIGDLFTVQHFVIVHASNRVEDGPHDLRVIDSSMMISDVQAEDNLVEL
jgi:hypothetical protein